MEGKQSVCDLCEPPKTFSNCYVCANHKRTVHEGKNDKFECEICLNKFATKYKLSRHIQGVHSSIRNFPCHFCGKSFKTRDVMLKHQRIHNANSGPFACFQCDLQFKFQSGLDYHTRRTHQKEEVRAEKNAATMEEECEFIVEEAMSDFEEKEMQLEQNGLQYHDQELFLDPDNETKLLKQIDVDYVLVEKITTTVNEAEDELENASTEQFNCSPLQCDDDNYSLQNQEEEFFDQIIEKDVEIENHVQEFSCTANDSYYVSDSKQISCDLCESTFKSKSNLNRHIQRKHNINGHKIICLICDKKFLLEYDMKRHMMSHDFTKRYSCPNCQKQFKTARSLAGHQRLIHSETPRNGKFFQCTHCDRTYFHRRHMQYHMKRHTGEVNYRCEECNLDFHYREAFRWHKIRNHKEKAPFNCVSCEKPFLHSTAYQKHAKDQCNIICSNENQKKVT